MGNHNLKTVNTFKIKKINMSIGCKKLNNFKQVKTETSSFFLDATEELSAVPDYDGMCISPLWVSTVALLFRLSVPCRAV